MPVILSKDVILDTESMNQFCLWTNTGTRQDIYLLPNSTRLYGRSNNDSIRLQYVAEVIRGDIRGDGEAHFSDIITALTSSAARNPVIPISSTGSLDFRTGTLKLPEEADYELYLDEVSSRLMLEKMNEGFLRTMVTNPYTANAGAMDGEQLPDGMIVEDYITGGMLNGWKLFWIGDTPETATDPEQVLIGLLYDEETDEIDAFRTSLNMIAADEPSVDVSLYIYRDSRSDRLEIEKYNVMFFDTPEDE